MVIVAPYLFKAIMHQVYLCILLFRHTHTHIYKHSCKNLWLPTYTIQGLIVVVSAMRALRTWDYPLTLLHSYLKLWLWIPFSLVYIWITKTSPQTLNDFLHSISLLHHIILDHKFSFNSQLLATTINQNMSKYTILEEIPMQYLSSFLIVTTISSEYSE